MSAAAEGSSSTTKLITSDESSSTTLKDQQKPATALEEDDEFEDFPIEGPFHHREVLVDRVLKTRQIGRKKMQRCLESKTHICGRRVGTTMTRARTSRNS